MFNFFKNLSPLELVIIGLVIVAIFGAGIVARMGKTGGQTYKEIKNIKKTFKEAVNDEK